MSLLSPEGGKRIVYADGTDFNAEWFGPLEASFVVCGESWAVDWDLIDGKVVVDTADRFNETAGNWIKHYGSHYRLASHFRNSLLGSHLHLGMQGDKVNRHYIESEQRDVAFGDVLPWPAGHKGYARFGSRQKYMEELRAAIHPRMRSSKSELCKFIERRWFMSQCERFPNARVIIVAHRGSWRRLKERRQIFGAGVVAGTDYIYETDANKLWIACCGVGSFGSPYSSLDGSINEFKSSLPRAVEKLGEVMR